MTITAEKVVDQAKEAASTVSDWVSDAADQVDFDSVKQAAADTTDAVVEKAAAVAPIAALATKRAFAKSTFFGLLVSAALAWFMHPTKGKERRDQAVAATKDAAKAVADRFSNSETTSNPSTSNLNYNNQ